MKFHIAVALFPSLWCAVPAASESLRDEPLAEVVVTASLRRVPLATMPASVTVLDANRIALASTSHLQELLPLVPNLNWATGSSRPRFFQLRGVGETEQWQGAPNSSVGFLIDDIDFSGLGMPAGSFDLGQVEVLRGPQGTAWGANALAGLIALRGRDPSAQFESTLQASAGDHGTQGIAALVGGAISPSLLGRLSVQQRRSDGFRRNLTLGRDDTNGYDETFARARLRLNGLERTRIDLTFLWADLDNGYDAFSLDNSRVTYSDKPGRDAQRSAGASLAIEHDWRGGTRLRSVTAIADSDIRYGFDGDWTAVPDNDYTSDIARRHRVVTQDLRWMSASPERCRPCWVAGFHAARRSEGNQQLDLYNAASYRELASDYDADSLAAYGETQLDLGLASRLTLGLRRERRRATYDDTDGTRFAPRDAMWGGQATFSRAFALEPVASGVSRWYVSLARGYRAGGFNIGAAVPDARRGFGPEYLWSAETGLVLRAAGGRLQARVAAFAMRRRDQQVATSLQLDPADPLSFLYLTTNAGRGRNDGVEAEWQWRLTERWGLSGSLGLLRARRADGRDQEHAPRHQLALAVDWQHPRGWFARLDAQHVARFYFSDGHDQLSTAYTLVSLKGGVQREQWSAELWVRNALNDRYAQRGFYFGNEPPDFPTKLYLQQSDARQSGVTISYRFGASH